MELGDVFWVEFPQGAGRAQAGHRPAIILQTATASDQLPTVLVVPLTTQTAALRFPGTVLVEVDPTNGLSKPSVAMVFQLTAIDQQFVGARIGSLSITLVEALLSALADLTFFDDSTNPQNP